MSKQWDAKFCGVNKYHNIGREKKAITVFAMSREDAVNEVVKEAGKYGYDHVTVDHITRIGQ